MDPVTWYQECLYFELSNKCGVFADVQTAVAAKEALEGHSIYEGGFCKLHISYSRHTDLSIKVKKVIEKFIC